ncbi:hypothetical protein Tco_1148696 [Tanacetum coccineum]
MAVCFGCSLRQKESDVRHKVNRKQATCPAGSNTTLRNHITQPHCEAIKAQQNQNPKAGQTFMARDGSVFRGLLPNISIGTSTDFLHEYDSLSEYDLRGALLPLALNPDRLRPPPK